MKKKPENIIQNMHFNRKSITGWKITTIGLNIKTSLKLYI